MQRFALFLAILAGFARGQPAWRLANDAIEVTLSANGALTVVDRASGTKWDSIAPDPAASVSQVVLKEKASLKSSIEIDGVPLHLNLSPEGVEPAFNLVLSAPAQTPLNRNVLYPFPLRAPASDYRMVLPHKAGLLFTVQDAGTNRKFTSQYPCYGSGLSMPWFGVTDLRRGLMMVMDTPEGSGVEPRVAGQVFAPQVYWQPSRDSFGYARKLHCRLFDAGGYVAMCKHYRNRLIRDGRFVTLREKQKSRPQLNKLIGAIDLHARGSDQEQMEVVKYLESKGVKRMLLNSGASRQTLDWMRERGYLTGTYRLYTDIHPNEPGYPQDAYTEKDGNPTRGFAYSEKHKSTYRCSLLQLPLMKEQIPPLVRDKGYEAIFLDVVTSGAPRECYSPDHPLDRRQDQKTKIDLLKYTTGLGLVVGSEDGSDWAAPYLEYFEGMVMPRRFGYMPGITVSNWPSKFDLNDEYINVDLNEKVRAPLWDLVFHDSVVSTWRWNFTPDRYSDPKWWNKHDMLHIIGGDMPIFLVSRKHLETNGDRIVQTYKDVSEWNARIGWDELVDHQDLTPDRTVQESRFSSGWAATVNFSEASFRIHRWK